MQIHLGKLRLGLEVCHNLIAIEDDRTIPQERGHNIGGTYGGSSKLERLPKLVVPEQVNLRVSSRKDSSA